MTTTKAILIMKRIGSIVRVSIRAFCDACYTDEGGYQGSAASHVLGMSDKFKVLGSHAIADKAKVIPVEAIRRAAHKKEMGADGIWLAPERAIARAIAATRPQPAASQLRPAFRDRPVFIDLRPEALLSREAVDALGDGNIGADGAVGQPAVVMGVTPSAAKDGAIAFVNGTSRLSLHWKSFLSGAMQPDVSASRLHSILQGIAP